MLAEVVRCGVMAENANALDSVIREILEFAGRDSAKPVVRKLKRQFHCAGDRDYADRLKALFSLEEMRELVADFRSALPALNQEVFRIREPRRLAEVAAELGAHFRTARFEGDAGKSLRGFYIDHPGVAKAPLICVNTANHPVAVASAFWHEVGHHLTSCAFGTAEPVRFSLSSSYAEHLDQPAEIAADIVSALAAYPKRAAQRLFSPFIKAGTAPDIGALVFRARAHLRAVAGFDFQRGVRATENLHYLAGMMHFIRLRWVLFSEYKI